MTGHIFYSFGTLKLNLKSYGDYVPLFFTETLFVENSLFFTAPLLFLFLYFAAFYFSSFFYMSPLLKVLILNLTYALLISF